MRELEIFAVDENGNFITIDFVKGEQAARKIAAEEAEKIPNGWCKVYIRGFRNSDSQRLYLNRDGYGPVGHSW